MRKIIMLIVSVLMLVGGICLVGDEILFAKVVYFRFVIGGAILATVGAYLIWCDFIAPILGIKTWEDKQIR